MASTSLPTEDPTPPEPNPPLDNEKEKEKEKEKESVYKTKTIHFLGRTTPIILQNDNGPCPLLAICNVLLLRNHLNLSPDIAEVSQEKLLHLVAERLLDSNTNVNNKDEGYIKNQQQNVADAMNLLPRLATGIDVNTKFRRIDDFEFTPECAIFDLLDIPLYHGWIVDPQDPDTAIAIGAKAYNALMEELVALETESMDDLQKSNPVEDCIDFAAATAATLGVPSPCLSKTRSFNDSPCSVSSLDSKRKGDLEEEEEILRVLKLSETESSTIVPNSFVVDVNEGVVYVASEDNASLSGAVPLDSVRLEQFDAIYKNNSALGDDTRNVMETCSEDVACSLKPDLSDQLDRPNIADSEEVSASSSLSKNIADTDQIESSVPLSSKEVPSSMDKDTAGIRKRIEKVEDESSLIVDVQKPFEFSTGVTSPEISGSSAPKLDSDSSSGRVLDTDGPETFTSKVESTEPIYEGEDCILGLTVTTYEDREPVYEGEVILARQHKTGGFDVEITPQQGELIRNFLKINASQLSFYGLFCLQDGLKERELCVFFRNNHFSTMFKYNGELYLLATDQGYFNQPDLVWEKLNEVNGDTLFMTSNFKEFKVESHANDTWDEDNAMATTADYLATIDSANQAGLDVNSDLQLAIALQQQEFEQQQQQQPQRRNMQQQSIGATSRLITGPQGPRSSGRTSSSSSRPEAKPKDKCTLM